MPRPPIDCIWAQNPEGLTINDVVLESHFAKRLRPHQREGITFLYECVMGFRSHRLPERISCSSACDFDLAVSNPVYGCILADEMGLGKTVQVIALLWLLLTQGPYGGRPIIRRCLIVTPGSLMQNWASEISKWLGRERLPVFCVNQGSSVKNYLARNNISAPPVIIMSYEMFLQNSHDVCNIPYLDMVICDEGHRLKNATIHTSMALRQIPARRRILLTGTPVQNDLNELWSLADFCTPGSLGSSLRAFRDEWLVSSSKNKYPTTELSDCESKCCQRSRRKLSRILEGFFLRRTTEVLHSDLMSKRILLLSSQAGGMGLNLTGADHLILYDVDWNPANDLQALARIWRPGQLRPVRLYRLITADGLEERMFQRQAAKMALSFNAIVSPFNNDCGSCVPSFKPSGTLTKEELRVGLSVS
ncbi:DNA repair and recombination protein RAD54B [Paragonimus westermani]|uniref:DNA repair and recombination protein RAD54B n=1 Tax=Paragonimus westermani TaxID=34504 RepID=A0A5J4NJX5_9TREM|nr:DNA repair and recombination protein RAD54B [Paragonimus westermani]